MLSNIYMANTNNKMNELGALWGRKSAKGEKFLSGKFNLKSLGFDKDVEVIIFSNKNKNGNLKAPDYRVYESTPFEKKGSPKTATVATTPKPVVQEEELI